MSSSQFENRSEIPKIYRFDYGQNINPPLNFEKIPQKAKSLVMIIEDIDNPNICINWVLWNISPSTKGIKQGEIPLGAIIGKNFLDSNSFYGFCPLQGRHTYSFTLFALDSMIQLDPDSSISELFDEIYSNILEKTEITGYCEKLGEFILE
ncbi:MAG: YbhB/YbcL family Raf kinase inhibitor-like protein [Candidatus Kariarchaeaceae archaeon]